MKALKILGACVAIVLVLGIGWLIFVNQDITEIHAEMPSTSTTQLPPLPEQESTIVIPITIPTDTVAGILDREAPRDLSGSLSIFDNLLGSCTLRWRANRGEIAARNDIANKSLKVSTPISGGGNVSCLPDPTFSGSVELTLQPKVGSNWRVDPRANATIRLTRAEVGPFSVRGEVRPRLQRLLDGQVARLNEQVNEEDFLREALEEQWEQLCRNIPVDADSTLWLQVRPKAVRMAQPAFSEQSIRLQFGIDAMTHLTSKQEAPTCSFPDELLLAFPSDKKTRIVLSSTVDFGALEKVINRALDDAKGQLVSDRFLVTIDGVGLHSNGGSIFVETKVTARSKHWFNSDFAGTLYVLATPRLDVENQTVVLEDLAIDVGSRNKLLDVLGELFEPILLRELSRVSSYDLKPEIARLRNEADSAFEELTSESVMINGGVDRVELTRLDVGSTELQVVLVAEGVVSVMVQPNWMN